jgi:hypothetical protein
MIDKKKLKRILHKAVEQAVEELYQEDPIIEPLVDFVVTTEEFDITKEDYETPTILEDLTQINTEPETTTVVEAPKAVEVEKDKVTETKSIPEDNIIDTKHIEVSSDLDERKRAILERMERRRQEREKKRGAR